MASENSLDSAQTAALLAHDPRFDKRNRLVIAVLMVSTFVVILNETLMIVAIPHLMTALGVTAGAAQWLTTAFLLTMSIVIPVTGFLLQRMNTRPVFLLAMTLFSVGTLMCALASGLAALVVGRVIQACGTAVMMPLLMTTIMMLVPEQRRGQFMGNVSVVISVAPAIGPAAAGFILSQFDWPWLFWLVLPISLSALAFGYFRIVNVTVTRYAPVDIPSVALSGIAFGGIVYGLSSMGQIDTHNAPIAAWKALTIGIFSMVIFIWRQLRLQKREQALLDLRTFKSHGFSISLGMMAIAMMTFFGAIILLPIYMQNVLALSTLQTGLIFLPGGLIMGLLAPWVGRLYDRHGPVRLVVPGALIFSAVLWGMTQLDTDSSWQFILLGHLLIGTSLALVFTPLFTASMSSIPPPLYSHGSALLGSIQQLAGAAGVALLIALMSVESARLTSIGTPSINALAGGIRNAFLWAALLSLVAVITAFFVRRPVAMHKQ
ncbi:MAG: DHA2 family efflux MFS transporter permease subunit [Gammaproteobacteria bacterium]|nr:DHA2 family efflux MFS transporter permease subunit [Gammaproteobacteria bacterium]